MVSELSIQSNIIRELQRIGCKVIKVHVGRYTEEGTPDLLGSYQGRSFALECKKPGEYPTKKQNFEMMEWRGAGAISQPVWSVNDALTALGLGIDTEKSPWYNTWVTEVLPHWI